jgi:hypothetical protein
VVVRAEDVSGRAVVRNRDFRSGRMVRHDGTMVPRPNLLPRARVSAALGAVLALGLLAGCGGPSGSADGSASPTPTPTASSVEVPPDAVVPDSDGGGVATSPDTTSPDPAATDDAAACAALQDAWSTTNQALVNLSSEHPRNLVNSFRVAGEAMAGVRVLDAVADDWADMSAYLTQVNGALEDVDANDAEAVATALNDTITADDTRAVTAAAGRITDFLAADCAAP